MNSKEALYFFYDLHSAIQGREIETIIEILGHPDIHTRLEEARKIARSNPSLPRNILHACLEDNPSRRLDPEIMSQLLAMPELSRLPELVKVIREIETFVGDILPHHTSRMSLDKFVARLTEKTKAAITLLEEAIVTLDKPTELIQ